MASFPVRRCLLAVVGLSIGLAGCSDDPAPDKEKNKVVSDDPGGKGGDQEQTAEGFAEEFLAAVSQGEADPGDLTDSFKALIAPPVLDADKEKGYDESGVRNWLTAAGEGGSFKITNSKGTAFRGDVAALEGKSTFGLTVVEEGENGYQVAWFLPTPVKGDQTPWEGTDAVEAAAFAAGFLDVLLAGGELDLEIAERMMAGPLKSEIGGSATAGDAAEGRDYNRSWLHLQLKKYAADSYRVTNADKADGDAISFTIEAGDTPLTVTVSRVDGRWTITGLESQELHP